MKNAANLFAKLRMKKPDEEVGPAADEDLDPDFEPEAEAEEGEEEPADSETALADFSDEELQAELDRRAGTETEGSEEEEDEEEGDPEDVY